MTQSVQIDRNNNFDLIRLYAAFNVVISHSVEHLRLPGKMIWDWGLVAAPGVPIFFVISGFLITESFLLSPNVKRFAWKRAVRIYPLLAINIIVMETLVAATGGSTPYRNPIGYLIFLVLFIATGSDMFAALPGYYRVMDLKAFFPAYPSGVLWTLSVEISFYVAAAAFLLFVTRKRIWGIAALMAAIVASVAFAMSGYVTASWKIENFVVPYFWMFGIGMVVRIYWSALSTLFRGRFLIWLAAYIGVTYLCYRDFSLFIGIDFKHLSPLLLLRMVILSGVVVSAAFTLPSLAKRLLNGNDFSYGIYLWHMLIVTTLLAFGLSEHWWLWLVVAGGTSALAALSWFKIERPTQKWKNLMRHGRTERSQPIADPRSCAFPSE